MVFGGAVGGENLDVIVVVAGQVAQPLLIVQPGLFLGLHHSTATRRYPQSPLTARAFDAGHTERLEGVPYCHAEAKCHHIRCKVPTCLAEGISPAVLTLLSVTLTNDVKARIRFADGHRGY